MKRFLSKITGLFSFRNFIKVTLWLITLVVLFYVEENWRGARAWAATKAQWEAKGETLDYAPLIPPAVPDAQNFALLPLFQCMPDPTAPRNWIMPELRRYTAGKSLPVSGNWKTGQEPDWEKLTQTLATNYRQTFPNQPLPASDLARFDALYPFVAELRATSATRPLTRWLPVYPPDQTQPTWITLYSGLVQIANLLRLHGELALHAGQPQLALEDFQLNLRLVDSLNHEPFYLPSLISVAIFELNLSILQNGVTQHAWNEVQLAELQASLGKLDFLSSSQLALRGDLYGFVLPAFIQASNRSSSVPGALYPLWFASGWIDQLKTVGTTHFLYAVYCLDPANRRVDSVQADKVLDENAGTGFFGWYLAAATGPLHSAIVKAAQAQVRLDEAQIVCALERYRLTRGSYPVSLELLAPFLKIPRDIMNGQPYRYQLHPDGAFLLYSVGWNRTDEGGKISYQPGTSKAEPTLGDWAWPISTKEANK